ncbi:helix-turn-helix domain-containing protein [Limibacterium fermenti]|uniref:helix-turn-helix domain-containing protein n=1 Tax=Limibacterium fermenti TaxID=3229863 RepID=UPI000E8F098E|nr:CI repressor [Porphyromonadaceae bacterium]
MGNKINKSQILDRLKEAYNLAGNSELARFLGVAPNTITNWYKRNSIDYDLVFTKCVDIDLTWLITGKESKLAKEKTSSLLFPENTKTNETTKELINKICDLSAENAILKKENEELRELHKKTGRKTNISIPMVAEQKIDYVKEQNKK